MKKENNIKRLEKTIKKAFNLIQEIQKDQFNAEWNRMIEASKTPIPEYKKGGNNIAIVPCGSAPKNEIVLKDNYSIRFTYEDKNIFNNGNFFNPSKQDIEGMQKKYLVESGIKNIDAKVSKLMTEVEQLEKDRRVLSEELMFDKKSSSFSEAFEKVKKEDTVLKEAYDEIEKNITLTECLSSEKPFDNLYNNFYTELGKLKEKEIKYTIRIEGEEYEIDKPI